MASNIKNIPAIQVGDQLFEIKDLGVREHLIEVQDTQPTEDENRVWIRDTHETSPIAVKIPNTDSDYTMDLGDYPFLEVGNIQYKNSEGGYSGVHVVAERSSAEIIHELQQKGAQIESGLLQILLNACVRNTEKGAKNGVATLNAAGEVPAEQLPSYVDDVLEYDSKSAFPNPGEKGKIYMALDTGRTYRWSGSAYFEVSQAKDVIHDPDNLTPAEKYNYVWSIAKVEGLINAINNARGAANGIATLDEHQKVPVAQLQNLINDNGGADVLNQTWTADKLAKFYTEFKTFEYYTAIQISEVSLTVVGGRNNLAEKGSTVTGLSLKYKINQAPHKIKINGAEITPTPSATEYTITEDSTDSESTHYLGLPVVGNTSKNYDVDVTDLIKIGDPDTSRRWVSRRATLTFTNKVKYGAAQDPRDSGGTIDDAFLNGLSDRVLSTGKVGTISVNAPGLTNYVWYALPSSYGECQFTVGVLTGGFTEVAKFDHQNESGFTTEYRVYRSVKGNLGSQTIKVT